MHSRYIEVPLPSEVETVEVHQSAHRQEQAGQSLQMRIDNGHWTHADGGKIRYHQRSGQARVLEIRCLVFESIDNPQIELQPLRMADHAPVARGSQRLLLPLRRMLQTDRPLGHYSASPIEQLSI